MKEGLQVEQVAKRFGPRWILREVSLSCAAGEVVVVTGENGAGKSTLLRIVVGLIEPDQWHVSLGGARLSGGGVAARRHLGYVPDSTEPLPDLTPEELVALVAALKGAPAPEEGWPLIDQLGARPIWRQRLSTLSLGQRKRAALLAALVGGPWLLVLDEPSNGLDPAGVSLLLQLIGERRRRGLGTLLSSNDAAFIEALGGTRVHLQGGRAAP
jgi:ABC-type multidrug transport system ATPase subunit